MAGRKGIGRKGMEPLDVFLGFHVTATTFDRILLNVKSSAGFSEFYRNAIEAALDQCESTSCPSSCAAISLSLKP